MNANTGTLLVVAGAAALAPILVDLVPGVRVPVVVVEILLGIVVGPQVLGLIRNPHEVREEWYAAAWHVPSASIPISLPPS
jgi:Kef-type K+ transport system membrane component KefB